MTNSVLDLITKPPPSEETKKENVPPPKQKVLYIHKEKEQQVPCSSVFYAVIGKVFPDKMASTADASKIRFLVKHGKRIVMMRGDDDILRTKQQQLARVCDVVLRHECGGSCGLGVVVDDM